MFSYTKGECSACIRHVLWAGIKIWSGQLFVDIRTSSYMYVHTIWCATDAASNVDRKSWSSTGKVGVAAATPAHEH